MGKSTTTIEISKENWKRLNERKTPGDSFDDVVGSLLDRLENLDEQTQLRFGSAEEAQSDDNSLSIQSPRTKEESPLSQEVEQAIRQLQLSVEANRAQWQEALRAAYQYLKHHGEVSKSEFIRNVYPSNKAGYNKARTWWRRIIRPGLKELPHTTKPSRGGAWRYEAE